MTYALINTAGEILRTQDFDAAPQLAASKGLRWVPANPPAYSDATQTCAPITPVTGEAVTYLVENIPLATIKTTTIAKVESCARQVRDQIVAGISPAEMASWPIKRAEALAYQSSSNAADAPNLAAEATARGVSLTVLAEKVLAKAAILAGLEARIAGNTGKHNDAIGALTAAAAVLAYDYSAGWPA
ncbi:MAG: hypothetical protein HY847_13015 [Betaproteobacteria bacterium]|nr:hypothetical protein [Betaproteobacteria bacterium]